MLCPETYWSSIWVNMKEGYLKATVATAVCADKSQFLARKYSNIAIDLIPSYKLLCYAHSTLKDKWSPDT